MMPFKALIISILIIISPPPIANAGGDTVLNGGGQAELNSYTVVDNLKSYVSLALEQQISLNFTSTDIQDLTYLKDKLASANLNYPDFSILSSASAFQTQKKWLSPVTLNYKYLYDLKSHPVSFVQVASITLSAYLFQISHQNLEQIQICANKVFSNFQENVQKLPLRLKYAGAWAIMIQTMTDSQDQQHSYLSLEGSQSEDLNSILIKELPKCHRIEINQFANINIQYPTLGQENEKIQIQGQAFGRCLNSTEKASQFQTKFLFTLFFNNAAWLSDQTRVQIYDFLNKP